MYRNCFHFNAVYVLFGIGSRVVQFLDWACCQLASSNCQIQHHVTSAMHTVRLIISSLSRLIERLHLSWWSLVRCLLTWYCWHFACQHPSRSSLVVYWCIYESKMALFDRAHTTLYSSSTLCLKKFRTPVIRSDNSNKSRPILIIFGTKYRNFIFIYWHFQLCDTW